MSEVAICMYSFENLRFSLSSTKSCGGTGCCHCVCGVGSWGPSLGARSTIASYWVEPHHCEDLACGEPALEIKVRKLLYIPKPLNISFSPRLQFGWRGILGYWAPPLFPSPIYTEWVSTEDQSPHLCHCRQPHPMQWVDIWCVNL